jgi:hypothetical protein
VSDDTIVVPGRAKVATITTAPRAGVVTIQAAPTASGTVRITGLPGEPGPPGPPGETNEVWIGPDEPTDPNIELWYDTDAEPDTTALDAKADKATKIDTALPLIGGGDLTVDRTLGINTFTPTLKGAVPAPLEVTGKYLKDDGTWELPAPPAASGSKIHDGTTAPTPAIGVPGDYYVDTSVGVLYGPKSVSGYGPEQRITIAGAPDSSALGWEYASRVRFTRVGRITKIRYQRRADSGPLVFRVWDSLGTLVAGPISSPETGGGAFTLALPTPVPVSAGSTFTVSVFATSGGTPSLVATPVVTSTADCAFLNFYRSVVGGVFPTDLITTLTYFVEPIYEPSESWSVTVRTVPGLTPTVSKATTPTAADYGQATIPVGAVWVVMP